MRRKCVRAFVVIAAVVAIFASHDAMAQYSYERMIYDACAAKGCDAALVIDVMYCESGGDPEAYHPNPYGGADVGLFQINDATWGDVAWSGPEAQIDWATTMIANGGIGHWWPSQHCWG